MKKLKKRDIFIDYIPMILTAALIIFFAVTKKQSFIKTLPTLITLVVQLFLVHANRFAFLLGGANAALYSVSYAIEGLYFQVISSAFISAPIQIASYFNWKKHSAKRADGKLQRISLRAALLTLVCLLGGWALCAFVLAPFAFPNANDPMLDSFSFALGTSVTILVAFRYLESQYLNIIHSMVSLLLMILMMLRNPENFNFVIISAYNLFRVIEASIRWTAQYRKQVKQEQQEKQDGQIGEEVAV